MDSTDYPPALSKMYSAFEQQQFGVTNCFMCGVNLNSDNSSKEHVIPLWAQSRYRLCDQRLTLLNASTIPYKQLTIPCCKPCNGKYLAPLEKRVSEAVLMGKAEVESLRDYDLFLWLGKIFYGLHFKELFLPADRAGDSDSTITTPHLLSRFQLLHSFLQGVRVPMVFVDCTPASIIVAETQAPADPSYQWWMRDGLDGMFISCQLGTVGLIAVFEDGGVHQRMSASLQHYLGLPMHPIQFRELAAMVYMKAYHCAVVPSYMLHERLGSAEPIEIRETGLGGTPDGKTHFSYNMEEYARVLASFTGCSVDDIYAPPDGVRTFLRNEDGSQKEFGFQEWPWPDLAKIDD
jgi:hypothetical protein